MLHAKELEQHPSACTHSSSAHAGPWLGRGPCLAGVCVCGADSVWVCAFLAPLIASQASRQLVTAADGRTLSREEEATTTGHSTQRFKPVSACFPLLWSSMREPSHVSPPLPSPRGPGGGSWRGPLRGSSNASPAKFTPRQARPTSL